MSLEETVGLGSTEAFISAMKVDSFEPTIIFSDWQAQSNVEIDGLIIVSDPWPGPGNWRSANVFWENGSQQLLFQARNIYWGEGLCINHPFSDGDTQNDLDSLMGNQKLWDFTQNYTDEMRVTLPDNPDMTRPFLLNGFEIENEREGGLLVLLAICNTPDSLIDEVFAWLCSGSNPDEEPQWRKDLKNAI